MQVLEMGFSEEQQPVPSTLTQLCSPQNELLKALTQGQMDGAAAQVRAVKSGNLSLNPGSHLSWKERTNSTKLL